jgi:response regulator RpfG family c-di-GMP phosphodiesterase
VPKGLRGHQILVTSRMVNLADVIDVFHASAGVDAAVSVARERAGSQFDPDLVEVFARSGEDLFGNSTRRHCGRRSSTRSLPLATE